MELTDAASRRRRRRRARPLGRLAPRRARRRRARAREGPDRRRRLRASPAGSCATTTARRRSPTLSGCRSRCSRPTRGLRLPPGRLPRRRARGPGRRPGRDPRRHHEARVRVRARGRRGGRAASTSTWTWPDWEAPVEALLHERRGGWADAMQTVRHLAERARGGRRRDRRGRRGDRVRARRGGVEAVVTSRGRIELRGGRRCARPLGGQLWEMLGLAPEIELGGGSPAADLLLEGAGGRVRARGRRRSAAARASEAARRAPRPGRAAALRPRRARAASPGAVGDLLPHGPDRRPVSPAAGCRCCSPSPSSTRTAPTTRRTRPSPASPSSSTSGLAAAFGRFRGRAGDWRTTLAGGIVAHTPDNYPVCDWVAAERLRDRRLRPRLQDARARPPGRRRRPRRRTRPRALPPVPLRARRDPPGLKGAVPVDLSPAEYPSGPARYRTGRLSSNRRVSLPRSARRRRARGTPRPLDGDEALAEHATREHDGGHGIQRGQHGHDAEQAGARCRA